MCRFDLILISCRIVSYGTIILEVNMSNKAQEIKDRLEKLKDISKTFAIDEAVLTRMLFKTTKHFEKIMDKKMSQFGLSCTSWGVLMITFDTECNKILPSELSNLLRQPKPTVTRLVDELIQKGFLAREHDVIDRRKIFISITEEGKKFMADNMGAHDEILKTIWKGCNVSLMLNELGKALDNMEDNYD